jgi:polar amino acid transport system substrate-binding protein
MPVDAHADKSPLVMVGDNWCPYNCAPDAAQQGYIVDILNRVLSQQYTLTYRILPWTRAIVEVEDGTAQILIATPATTKQKAIASVPFGIDRSCFFVRRGNPWRYSGLSDLKEVRLGVIQDYSYDDDGPLDTVIAGYRKRGDSRLEIASGDDALKHNFKKLQLGRMDVVIENENVARYMIQELRQTESIDFAGCANHHVATTHVAVSSSRRDAVQILAKINNGLAELRRTGELKKILQPYGMSDWQTALAGKRAK